MFGLPGGMEWVIIIFAIILLFGAKKIPELMRGMGKGISEFKKGLKDVETEIKSADTDVKKVDEKKD